MGEKGGKDQTLSMDCSKSYKRQLEGRADAHEMGKSGDKPDICGPPHLLTGALHTVEFP